MLYNAQGGFTWGELYTMPVYLRSFYAKQLIEAKKREKEEMDKQKNKSGRTPSMPSVPRR